jgi:hypothetical protein
VSGGDYCQIKVPHGLDRIRYDLLVTPREMKSAHNRIDWSVFKAGLSMVEDIDHTGVRACREHDDTLLCDIHRDEALIHDQFIEFPALTVESPAILTGKTAFEGGHAWDFAAYIYDPLQQKLRFGCVDNPSTVVGQCFNIWDILLAN